MDKQSIIEILRKTAEELDSILKTGGNQRPETENLNIKTVKGKPRFFSYSVETGRQEYVKITDEGQIKKLSQKYYEKRLKAAALKEKKQIESCLAILEQNPEASDVDKVLGRLPAAIRENIEFSELTGEGYARKWQEGNSVVKKRRTHRKDDYHKYKTIRGDYVGSKSEEIIADRLFAKGIPYHYEVAFTPEVEIDKSNPVYDEFGHIAGYGAFGFSPEDQDTLHPDFYVLNKRTGKAYFWEHLGKMDDAEYCRKNFNRFMRILDAGYVIGEDLLVTHEDARHPLMTESIDAIIEKYLQ